MTICGMDYIFNVLVANPQITDADYITQLIQPLVPDIQEAEVAALFQDVPYSFDSACEQKRVRVTVLGQPIISADFFHRENLMRFCPSAIVILLPQHQALQEQLLFALKELPREMQNVTRMLPIALVGANQTQQPKSDLTKLINQFEIQFTLSRKQCLDSLIKFLVLQSTSMKADMERNLGADFSVKYSWTKSDKKMCKGQ